MPIIKISLTEDEYQELESLANNEKNEYSGFRKIQKAFKKNHLFLLLKKQ